MFALYDAVIYITIMAIKKDSVIAIRMNKERKERLERFARKNGYTVSQVIENAITKYFELAKEGKLVLKENGDA